jgi:hypothetical protein
MYRSKKEFVWDLAKGEAVDRAVYGLSNTSAVVACEWDDETMFGYYSYGNKKDPFQRKIYYPANEEASPYIKLGNMKLGLDGFVNTSDRFK